MLVIFGSVISVVTAGVHMWFVSCVNNTCIVSGPHVIVNVAN